MQASLNEIKELLENEDEQQIEYEAIIGKKRTAKNTDLNILPTTSSNYYFLFFPIRETTGSNCSRFD